jgi:hypothetical protein
MVWERDGIGEWVALRDSREDGIGLSLRSIEFQGSVTGRVKKLEGAVEKREESHARENICKINNNYLCDLTRPCLFALLSLVCRHPAA